MGKFQQKVKIFLAFIWLINIGIYADWADRFSSATEVTLSEILEKPETWIGVPVRIPIRFFEPGDVYIPYRTRFSPDVFWNFSAWDVQSHIWDPAGFDKIFPYFYVEKDNPEFRFFQKLESFQTVCILAQVEGFFAGKPFIRVVWGSIIPGNLNIHNLKLLNKALKHYKQREFKEAIALFQKVFESEPPDDIKVMLHKAMAKYYIYEKKSYYSAIEELKKAHAINSKDLELEELAYLCHLYSRPQVRPIPLDGNQQGQINPLEQHNIILEPDPLPEPVKEVEPEQKPVQDTNKKVEPKKTETVAPVAPKIENPKVEVPSKPVDILDDLEDLEKNTAKEGELVEPK